ncbi:MAG TPA: glycosyltransferase family 2 protein, partial [Paraburkholderia sp.]|nr:glycosyltransferase family 2 protein [Paraburkholderia sp.]
MKAMTIVICSYNYERYIGEAIDSALAQEPDRTRVVVIDDGSTDRSREIIESYGDRITAVFKQNGGQATAYNLGLELADTEYLLFLDSDDVLYEGAITNVLRAFESGDYVKVQFRLDVIGPDGARTRAYVPNSKPPSDCTQLIRKGWLYPSPPASGNAYRVSALRKILPIPVSEERRIAADFFAIYGVSLLGPIFAIETAQGGYRIHRSTVTNDGKAPQVGLSIANCQDLSVVIDSSPKRWEALRELVKERLGEDLPPHTVDFSYEKARLCARVYEAPIASRWHWLVFDSGRYFHS